MKNSNFLFPKEQYLTDGGFETTLIFFKGFNLNYFAAFELLKSEKGLDAMSEYYEPYLKLAEKYQLGFVLESPTWRANTDWGRKLGYTDEKLFEINRQSIRFIRSLAKPYEHLVPDILISGNIGPRGDGYKAENKMTPDEANRYHLTQINAFALEDVDLVTAMTLTYSDEAIGIVNAARSLNLPVVISFTVETDGTLPGGETLQEAIEWTDRVTGYYPEHFMINCAHPEHFIEQLEKAGRWKNRIKGIRANASLKSHAELDESETLDTGDACLLSEGYMRILDLLPELKVVGGCCGTDERHIEEICKAFVNKLAYA